VSLALENNSLAVIYMGGGQGELENSRSRSLPVSLPFRGTLHK
jgi:hypothetical protein